MPYKNNEDRKARSRSYYWAHRDKCRAYAKEYYKNNKDRMALYNKEYRIENDEQIKENRRRRLEANPDYDHHAYLKRADAAKLYAKKQREHRTALVGRFKRIRGCLACGYRRCPRALEFHHVSGDKEQPISQMLRSSMSKLKEELGKCVVLCANCHSELHAGFIDLPE